MRFSLFKKDPKSRIVEIDFIRGVLILFMIVDHLFYDFWGIVYPYFSPNNLVQLNQIINLSRFATWYWEWPVRIITRFVILTIFFIIIYALLKYLFKKFFPNHQDDFKWIILGLGIVIIALGLMFNCWKIYPGNYPPPGPEGISDITWSNFFLVIIGRYQDTFALDWLPLFPYLGFLFIGAFLGETLYKEKKSYFKPLASRPSADDSIDEKIDYYGGTLPYKGIKNVITFVGRYSIFFYLLHQIVLILILGVIFLSMGYTLNLPF